MKSIPLPCTDDMRRMMIADATAPLEIPKDCYAVRVGKNGKVKAYLTKQEYEALWQKQ